MNILLISYDYPPNKGGISNVAYQIASQLNNMGEAIIFVAQKAKGDKGFDKNKKFKTIRCTNIFFLRELALILLLPFLIIRYKIDVIYLLFWCQGGVAVFLTSSIFKIPYILHAYGEEFVDYKKTMLDRIKYGFLRQNYKRLIFRHAHKIIAISNYTKEIVIKSGIQNNKVDVIKLGVDINRFKPDMETGDVLSKHNLYGKKVLFSVSRLNKYKGHDIVINLMPQSLEKIPNVVYVIGGSGKDREFLETLVKKLNLQNNVIFTGFIEEASLPLYYNACDIYIMLTRERKDTDEFEGFGLVFLEANSCGKPVIGARTGGIPDAIVDGKTGYLVDPDNNQEILDKITLLLENRELAKQIGEAGRSRILNEGLVWENTAGKIQEVLITASRKSK